MLLHLQPQQQAPPGTAPAAAAAAGEKAGNRSRRDQGGLACRHQGSSTPRGGVLGVVLGVVLVYRQMWQQRQNKGSLGLDLAGLAARQQQQGRQGTPPPAGAPCWRVQEAAGSCSVPLLPSAGSTSTLQDKSCRVLHGMVSTAVSTGSTSTRITSSSGRGVLMPPQQQRGYPQGVSRQGMVLRLVMPGVGVASSGQGQQQEGEEASAAGAGMAPMRCGSCCGRQAATCRTSLGI